MLVREFAESDLERIKALHRQSGFGYELADFSGKEFFSAHVVPDGPDVAMAAFLRLSAEAYLICDPGWRNPAWRMEALRGLHVACHADAQKKGVGDVMAFLPPDLEKRFGRRLLRLGWKHYAEEEWKCWGYQV